MSQIIDEGTYGAQDTHADASVWGPATTWALISAAVGFVLVLLQYNTGGYDVDPSTGQPGGNWIWTLISILVSITLIYLGLKAYRDQVNAGVLTLGRGVLWSLAYGLIGGALSAVLLYVFFGFIAPDIVENIALAQETMMEEQGMSGAELEQALGFAKIFVSPWFFSISALVGSVIGSVIIGLIVSLILKTR